MFDEGDLLPLSGLQHFTFCERRWALVQIERLWEDNVFTAEGSIIHDKAHSGEIESRPGVLIRRTLPVRSFRLGLSGQVDVIEFVTSGTQHNAVRVPGRAGFWKPCPIEYKRSRDKAGSIAYQVQLCGQAMCLEEMWNIHIPEGSVFDAAARRRQAVPFTDELRSTVEHAAARMHELFAAGRTPAPVYKKACHSCSLVERCQPQSLSNPKHVGSYLARAVANLRSGA